LKNKIHILGATGSEASTFGSELSLILPHVNLDGDDYFWIEKFTKQRTPKERVQLLLEDLSKAMDSFRGSMWLGRLIKVIL
jgi:adenylate kinase family enzyme